MRSILKSITALIISIILIVTMSSVFVYAADDQLSVMVASDTHFEGVNLNSDISNSNNLPESELYFHTTIQGQMNAESEAILRSLLNTFANSDEKYLLISGDLTNGSRIQHKNFVSLLKKCESETGKSIFVINGNHDINSVSTDDKIDINEFKSMYRDFGYNEALASDDLSGSYTVNLDDNYRLIAIDSCIYGKDDGRITEDLFKWIEEQSGKAERDGKHLIGMMHHSVLEHFSLQPMLDNQSGAGKTSFDFASSLADMGIKYVFTGHIHANDIAGAVTKKSNRIYDVMTGSLITCPNSYRIATFSDNNVRIKTDYIKSIDTLYLPKGYNDAQLNIINNDFSAYSKGFFEAGVQRWINEYLGSARKVSSFLKVKKGTTEYENLDGIMKYFKDALNLPFYETDGTIKNIDSIEKIALSVGVKIPKSDYEFFYQPASKIMDDFFAGDENITVESSEVQLVYAVLKAGLAYSIGNMIGDNKCAKSIKGLLKSVGIKDENLNWNDSITFSLAKINFSENVASEIMESIINPIIEGFSNDKYSPSDLNVSLEPYSSDAISSVNDSPLSYIKEILLYFLSYFKIVFRTIITE